MIDQTVLPELQKNPLAQDKDSGSGDEGRWVQVGRGTYFSRIIPKPFVFLGFGFVLLSFTQYSVDSWSIRYPFR